MLRYYFKKKVCKDFKINNLGEHHDFWASDTWGLGGAMASPLFCVVKRKKQNKGKNERVSKQKLLKGCRQSQNISVLTILKCLEFKKFSC